MGSNWNVQREEPSIEELEEQVKNLRAQAAKALKSEGGKYSRDFRNADYLLRHAERQLESALSKEEQRAAKENLTPKEIVDRLMER